MSLKRIKLMLFSAIILVGLFFFIQTHQTRNVEKQKTSNIVGKLLIDTTGKDIMAQLSRQKFDVFIMN